MKKIKYLIFLVFIMFLTPKIVLASDNYYVKVIKEDKTVESIGEYSTYNEAKNIMDSNTIGNAVILYKGKIINANYAVANIGGREIIYMYQNKTDKEQKKNYYTYIESDWGSDAAFIDYYDSKTPMAKVAISGFVGWTLASNVDVMPINTSNIKIAYENGVRIRSEASTDSNILGLASYGTVYTYFDIVDNEGYTWYKVITDSESGYGYIASNGSWVEKFSDFNTYYTVSGNVIKHVYRSNKHGKVTLTLGPNPSYLENGKKYYSFDGIYFYNDLITMLGDYKKGIYENSINYTTPYYNYYMYLPSHSLTGYTKDDLNNIITNFGYTSKPLSDVVYVDNDGHFLVDEANRSKISALYNEGASFITFQNNYGINAFSAFSTAINESGKGTNTFSIGKNNVLSIGVCDGCKYKNTKTYESVYDNLVSYASLVSNGYSNPNNNLYYGSHSGNKGSGMNIMYASDPYWGEKQAQIYYFKDRDFGGSDYNSNIIGIKMGYEDVSVHKLPYNSSNVIYKLKNNSKNQLVPNIPLIIIGEVTTEENGISTTWYKVYTDISLDDKGNITDGPYVFNRSFGFVKKEYIYVTNSNDIPVLNNDGFIETDGLFHLEEMVFQDNKLKFTGFQIVYGTNNLISNNPKYKLTLINQNTDEVFIKELNPSNPVFEAPKIDEYDYSGSWFSSEIDLSDIKQGDYTMYVTGIVNGYQATSLVTNKLFNEKVSSKYTDSNGRGYQLKSNYYDVSIPLELYIRDNGLISDKIPPTLDDMYNQYYSISLNNGYLDLVGTSHNVGADYSDNSVLDRDIYITDLSNMNNVLNVKGSLLDTKPYVVSLRVSDNLDKTNAWYKANIDVSNLNPGVYSINIKTRANDVEDYGEVNDILFTEINASMEINNKRYFIRRNDSKRFRLELVVENIN